MDITQKRMRPSAKSSGKTTKPRSQNLNVTMENIEGLNVAALHHAGDRDLGDGHNGAALAREFPAPGRLATDGSIDELDLALIEFAHSAGQSGGVPDPARRQQIGVRRKTLEEPKGII